MDIEEFKYIDNENINTHILNYLHQIGIVYDCDEFYKLLDILVKSSQEEYLNCVDKLSKLKKFKHYIYDDDLDEKKELISNIIGVEHNNYIFNFTNNIKKYIINYIDNLLPKAIIIEEVIDNARNKYENSVISIKRNYNNEIYTHKLRIFNLIDEGSYSFIYNALFDNKECIVKISKLYSSNRSVTVNDFKECIIHGYLSAIESLLTIDNKNICGVVPLKIICNLKLDTNNNCIITIMDKMDGNCYKLFQNTTNENDIKRYFNKFINQIINQNNILNKLCKFNHLDFKINNVLYKKKNGDINFYICDFGMSNITLFDKYKISNDDIFARYKLEPSPVYDIVFLLLTTFDYSINIHLNNVLLKILKDKLNITIKFVKNKKKPFSYMRCTDDCIYILYSYWKEFYSFNSYLFIDRYFNIDDLSNIFNDENENENENNDNE